MNDRKGPNFALAFLVVVIFSAIQAGGRMFQEKIKKEREQIEKVVMKLGAETIQVELKNVVSISFWRKGEEKKGNPHTAFVREGEILLIKE